MDHCNASLPTHVSDSNSKTVLSEKIIINLSLTSKIERPLPNTNITYAKCVGYIYIYILVSIKVQMTLTDMMKVTMHNKMGIRRDTQSKD